jgi:uncharacterized protein YtpQ (UPF0354 family)
MLVSNGDGILLSRDAFSELVAERLEQHPEIEVLSRSEQDLELRVRGLPIRTELGNYYSVYLRSPGQMDAVVQNLIDVTLSFVPNRAVSDYDTLSERIYPMLKPISMLADVTERKLPMLVFEQFLADLIITYVIDEPKSVVFINENHLERWQVNQRDIHAQALANLRRRTVEERDYTVAGSGDQQLFIWNTGDGYDATRLLLSDVLAKWQTQIGGNLVIGIPNRDFLIAFSDNDRSVVENIARQLQHDARTQPYPLTDRLFTVLQGQVREYDWE